MKCFVEGQNTERILIGNAPTEENDILDRNLLIHFSQCQLHKDVFIVVPNKLTIKDYIHKISQIMNNKH